MSFFKRYSGFLLLILVLFSFVIRFLWLDKSPQGLLIDEAHFGYISYSLLETGKDEHGVPWPLVFKGFGDQKLPVQAYLLIPLVKLLGLNAVAVRLPAAIAGSLLVAAIYWLLREFKFKTQLALFGSLIVALSPWTFILSRFAYEANLGLLFFTLGLIFLVKITQEKGSLWAICGSFFLALTWYTYIAFRPVTLLFSLFYLLILLVVQQVKWQKVLLFFALFIILVAPLFQPHLLSTGAARFNQVGILADEGLVMAINQNRTFCDMKLSKTICYGLWNKPLYFGKELVRRFVSTYSPHFLFTDGNEQLKYQAVENFGQFYLILLPLLFLGIVGVLFKINEQDLDHGQRAFILLGLLIGPVASILAGQPQLVRLSPLLPFLILVIVLGLDVLNQFIIGIKWRKFTQQFLAVIFILSSIPFLVNFYTIHTVRFDEVYQSYLPELFEVLDAYPKQVSIYIRPFFSDPIMAYAYYQQISPDHYQHQVNLAEEEGSGFQHAVGLDNFKVTEEPMVNLGCRAVSSHQEAYYVTNEEFKNPKIDYLHRIASENGAMYYAYIYDAAAYAIQHPELCLD